MRNLGDLAKDLKRLPVAIADIGNRLSLICAETILFDLVKKTPVDTSNAISNWQVSIGSFAENEIDPYFTGSKGSTFIQSSNAAFSVGIETLSGKLPGQTIFIFNCADYIWDLDKGSSKQEPAGFINRAIVLGKLAVKEQAFIDNPQPKYIPKGKVK